MKYLFITLVLLVIPNTTFAQLKYPPRASSNAKSTTVRRDVEFEILTPRKGNTALAAQKWGRLFGELKLRARIRQERFEEKDRIEQKKYGVGQMILIVARIDRSGDLVCQNKKFRLSQGNKIAEWVEELKTFGVQGSPEGKPAWGLSRQQFESIHTPLKKKLRAEVLGKSITAALKEFQFDGKTSLRIAESTRDQLLKPESLKYVSQEYRGVSQGTALAMLLAEYGLCFRPRRTSTKEIQLVVEPSQNISDPWSFGWDMESVPLAVPDPSKPKVLANHRLRLAPKLFDRTLVELNDVPARKVLDSIERQSTIPIFYDLSSIRLKKIDLNTVLVSYTRRKASWNQLLKSVAFQAGLKVDLRVDEVSQPFIWVSVPVYPNQKR